MKKEFVFICTGKDCKKRGAKGLCKQVKKSRKYKLIKTKCMDACKKAPNIIYDGKLYLTVSDEMIEGLHQA